MVAIDERYAAALRFRDAPRAVFLREASRPQHQFQKVMIVSGDRESEVRYLAEQVGITDIHAQKSPKKARHRPRGNSRRQNIAWGDGITTHRP